MEAGRFPPKFSFLLFDFRRFINIGKRDENHPTCPPCGANHLNEGQIQGVVPHIRTLAAFVRHDVR